jgi:hypothetical protein
MNISTLILSPNYKLYSIIILCFILPWIIGIFLYFKDKGMMVTIAPFSCSIGFILNTIGIDLGYFYPMQIGNMKPHTIAIFANIGLLTVEACIFIYLIAHTKIRVVILNLILSVIASLLDMIFIYANILVYTKGWNLQFSLLTYFLTFFVIYLYYLWIKNLQIVVHH